MSDIVTIFLVITGTAFALLASVAVVRMPDLYTRMHGATKSATLGVGCTILAAAIRFADLETATVAILVIGFLFLTAPVAAHMIGRAAHRRQIPKWSGTIVDESPLAHSAIEAKKYQSPQTTGLTFTVGPGENELPLIDLE